MPAALIVPFQVWTAIFTSLETIARDGAKRLSRGQVAKRGILAFIGVEP